MAAMIWIWWLQVWTRKRDLYNKEMKYVHERCDRAQSLWGVFRFRDQIRSEARYEAYKTQQIIPITNIYSIFNNSTIPIDSGTCKMDIRFCSIIDRHIFDSFLPTYLRETDSVWEVYSYGIPYTLCHIDKSKLYHICSLHGYRAVCCADEQHLFWWTWFQKRSCLRNFRAVRAWIHTPKLLFQAWFSRR